MMPYDAYKCYLAMKNHFTKDNYDYIKYRGKVSNKKFFYFLISLLTCKLFKPEPILSLIECLMSCSCLASILLVVIVIFREVILHRKVTLVGIKGHHKKVIERFFWREFFPPFMESKNQFGTASALQKV